MTLATVSLGEARAEADRRIAAHRRTLGIALVAQAGVGVLFLLFPAAALGFVGLSAAGGTAWPSLYGAALVFLALLTLPGWLDPVHRRLPNVFAVVGRGLMALAFLAQGGTFAWLALFDAGFAVLLTLSYHRMVLAVLMSRP